MLSHLNWKSAIWAGLIAGVVFVMMEMLLVGTVGGESPWAPPRMIAAIALGEDALPPPATFDFGILMAALTVHFPLSVIYALIFAWVADRWQLGFGAALSAGLVFGILIYLVNFYGFTVLFPWFAMARNWISLLSHAVFGLVLGGAYQGLAKQTAGSGPKGMAA